MSKSQREKQKQPWWLGYVDCCVALRCEFQWVQPLTQLTSSGAAASMAVCFSEFPGPPRMTYKEGCPNRTDDGFAQLTLWTRQNSEQSTQSCIWSEYFTVRYMRRL